MTDEAVAVPAADVAPPTLSQVLEAKLAAAKVDVANFETKVRELESEIAAIPAHIHAMTWHDLVAKVESWFK
jgi:hypothetical protein